MNYSRDRGEHGRAAVIDLTGDMQANIEDLISCIGCRCGTEEHLRTILQVYSHKIVKLRSERDLYKRLYQQAIQNLNAGSWRAPGFHKSGKQTACNSNIFEMLNHQLELACDLAIESECDKENARPSLNPSPFSFKEDSLLLTESNIRQCQQPQKVSQKPRPKRNFQEFLKQKAEQKLTHVKITEDIKNLSNKKTHSSKINRNISPLRQRFTQQFCNYS